MATTPLATSNLIQMRYAFEATPGVIPAVAFQNLRVKSQALQQNLTYTQSQELRGDRQIADQVQTDQSPNGTIGVELSFGTYDDFLAAALQGSWTTGPTIGGTDVAATAAGHLTSATAGKFTGIVVGHLVRTRGYVNAGNNADQVVIAVGGATDVTLAGSIMVAEAAGPSITAQVIGFRATNDIAAAPASGGLTTVTLDFTTLGLSVGQWISMTGFTNAANNGFGRVVSIAPHLLGLDNIALVAEGPNAGQTITARTSSFLRNGVVMPTFTVERQHADVGQFFVFSGMAIDEVRLDCKAGQILEGSFKLRGMSAALKQSGSSTGSPLPATTTPIFNAVSNIARLNEGGQAPTGAIKSLSIQASNALRDQKAVGTLGNIGIGDGTLSVTVTAEAYFRDQTLYAKYLNGAQTSFACALRDPLGNAYVLTIPAARLDACQIQGQAVNQDVSLSLTAKAKIDTLTNCMIQIDRIPV